MPGMAWQRRMQDAQHLRPRFEPARDGQSRLLMPFEPYRQSAQTPQSEIGVVGTFALPGVAHRALEPRHSCRICGHGAEHDVGVAADIFRAGLDYHVDAMVERTK